MDRLFSPWRYRYVSAVKEEEDVCVLCLLAAGSRSADEASLVLFRSDHHFVVLNLFPYTTGHLMVVPYAHVARLQDLSPEALRDLARMAALAEAVLTEEYRAEGLNLGMNLGKSAGAGIADHLHLHVVPRWTGDTNFMTVTGETRVLPEDLAETFRRLRPRFAEAR